MATLSRTVVVDQELDRAAAEILAGIGMSVDDAINRMLAQVVHDQCLPFAMHVPNADTIEAMEELERGDGIEYSSVEAMFRDMRN
jgi:addiction module RelB/DinJ family antitoxin